MNLIVEIKEFEQALKNKEQRIDIQMLFFHRLDQNKDNRLTSDEIPQKARRRILRADQNKDGIVTEAELRKVLR